MNEDIIDLAIIGAGPVGLAAALEAKRQGLSYVVYDKGVIVNSIFNYPTFMTFFTTADLLEIGDIPFPSTSQKPSRQMTLDYYRRIVHNEKLNVKQHSEVKELVADDEYFVIKGKKTVHEEIVPFTCKSKYVIIATGYFDNPRGLGGIPGEQGSNTSYFYTEPHQFYDHDVVVIGAGNSGAEAALDLYRHGARVTLIHNHPEPRSTIKYWVAPDLKNRLKEGSIKGIMPARVVEITPKYVRIDQPKEQIIPADFVFILTGFTPNIPLMKKWGLKISDDDLSVKLDENYECNIPGLFVVGSAGSGKATNKVFIENGREHAKIAVKEIKRKLSP